MKLKINQRCYGSVFCELTQPADHKQDIGPALSTLPSQLMMASEV